MYKYKQDFTTTYISEIDGRIRSNTPQISVTLKAKKLKGNIVIDRNALDFIQDVLDGAINAKSILNVLNINPIYVEGEIVAGGFLPTDVDYILPFQSFYLHHTSNKIAHKLSLGNIPLSENEIARYSNLMFVNFEPSEENFANWLYGIVSYKLEVPEHHNILIDSVQWGNSTYYIGG